MPANTKTRSTSTKPAATKAPTAKSKEGAKPIPGMPSETVGRVLAQRPGGATVRELASATKLPTSTVSTALGVLESAGAVVRVPGRSKDNPRTADLWRPAASTTTDTGSGDTDSAATHEGEGASAQPATSDSGTGTTETAADTTAPEATTAPTSDTSATAPDNAPTSSAPTAARSSAAGQFQILAVAAVLAEHPDGITGPDLVEVAGMRGSIAGRVLAAMEVAGAARRLPPNDDGVELWIRGDTDPATVDVSNAPTHTTCPTCGQRRRIAITTSRPRSTEPGVNGDGQPALRKGELRALVVNYINDHRDEILTAGVIAKELGRSSGAVRNNLDHLLAQGLIQHADDGEGREVMALPTNPDDQ